MLHIDVNSPAQWRQACSQAFVPLQVKSAAPSFRAKLKQIELSDGFTVTQVTSSESEVFRDPHTIKHHPREDLLISFQRAGSGNIAQHERQAFLTPGAASLYDSSSPYSLKFPKDMRQIVLQFPRSLIAASGRSFQDLPAKVIPGSALLNALTMLTLSTLNANQNAAKNTVVNEAFAVSMTSLIKAIVTSLPADRYVPLEKEMLLLAIKTYIDENCTDPLLNPSAIAKQHHVSLRFLQKLFAIEELSPSAYIRKRRLEHARKLLSEGVSVLNSAIASGHSDVDTFSRAFNREYGVRPSQMLR